LTGMTYAGGFGAIGSLSYAYDSAGRRTQVSSSLASTVVPPSLASASYNAANEITQWGGTTQTYDANGNLTNDGVNTYTWNARNQLISITGMTPASFQYDPFGRRVSKTVGGITTAFLYDAMNIAQELSGSTPSANILNGPGMDEFLSRADASGNHYFLSDAQGSTVALADSSGVPTTQYAYEPFGNSSVSGSPSTNSYQFTARESDTTSLYYFRARYYNTRIQRFISEDPAGYLGGVNMYAYTSDSPTNFLDPSGLLQVCCRRVQIPGPRQLGACHCWLKMENGNTLGGYDDGVINGNHDPTGPLNHRKNEDPDLHPDPKDFLGCHDPKDAGKCAEQRVLKAFNDLPGGLQYGVPIPKYNTVLGGGYGPGLDVTNVSNTIAGQTLRNAGIPFRFPSCAWGAENELLLIPHIDPKIFF
jgi:RHS repeat-associated protein